LLVLLGAFAAVVSCNKPKEKASVEVDSAPPPVCLGMAAKFRDTLSHATGTCHVNGDCGCYNPVVEEVGCGGVTDLGTSEKLRTIETDFLASGCPWPHLCAAVMCAPVCHEGKCIDRSSLLPR